MPRPDLNSLRSDLNGETAVVTGANSGIGFEIALELARRNGRVFLACRNETKGLDAERKIRLLSSNNNVFFAELDVSSLESVRQFAEKFKQTEKLDTLVCNAGVVLSSRKELSVDGFEMHFATNYLGHYLLTTLLIDLLKASGHGRIVNVSSEAQRMGKLDFGNLNSEVSYDGGLRTYSNTKLMQVLFTEQLHQLYSADRVASFALHPGTVKTEVFRHSWLMRCCVLSCFPCCFKTPVQGAKTALYCCLIDDETAAQLSGKYLVDCRVATTNSLARGQLGRVNAEKLWRVSADLIDHGPLQRSVQPVYGTLEQN